MKPVYALSGFAEWFVLMCLNIKPVENRKWPLPADIRCDLPQRIYLHASQRKAPQDHIDFIYANLKAKERRLYESINLDSYRGKIIGEITITRQIKKVTQGSFLNVIMPYAEKELRQKVPEYFSPWFFGPYGFVVTDGCLYAIPKLCKGQIRFFVPSFGPIKG